jgi:hypothetical protein
MHKPEKDGCKMPKLATPLIDIQVKNAKPKDKIYTLADGGGMYLEIAPSGSKIWRMSYRQPNGSHLDKPSVRVALDADVEVARALRLPANDSAADMQRDSTRQQPASDVDCYRQLTGSHIPDK